MVRKPTDPSEVRGRLLGAAADLLSTSVETSIGVRDIAAASGLSSRTFYEHFADKDDFFYHYWCDLQVAVTERIAARAMLEDDPIERIRAFCREIFNPHSAVTASGAPLRYYMRLSQTAPNKIARGMRPLYDVLVGLITDAQQAGLLHDKDPHRLAAPMLELLSMSATSHLYGLTLTPEPSSVEDVVDFCLDGLGARPDPSA